MKRTMGWPSTSALIRSRTGIALSCMARHRDREGRGRAWGFGRPYCKPTHGSGPAAVRRMTPQDAMAIELPHLPYERSTLEPHISAETVDVHHGKQQRAYVDRHDELVAETT